MSEASDKLHPGPTDRDMETAQASPTPQPTHKEPASSLL